MTISGPSPATAPVIGNQACDRAACTDDLVLQNAMVWWHGRARSTAKAS